jgi:hypothetical protein
VGKSVCELANRATTVLAIEQYRLVAEHLADRSATLGDHRIG